MMTREVVVYEIATNLFICKTSFQERRVLSNEKNSKLILDKQMNLYEDATTNAY